MNTLKGDNFVNRYRLVGLLTAISPIHIGTGEEVEEGKINKNLPEKDSKLKDQKEVKVSLIATDHANKPYIPGSALRGVIRHYLRNIFIGLGNPLLIQDPNFESDEYRDWSQEKQIDYMRNKASIWECLFGTPFAEGKAEFWDAPAVNSTTDDRFALRGWIPERNTYTVKSVAIDPETGTADPHKLYTFEVAPAGLCFQVNIVGQNLSQEELGMLLFGLESFNSDIYPITIGAMAGRGFGRMRFELREIHRLITSDLPDWIKQQKHKEAAGYYALKDVTAKKNELINEFKKSFQKILGGAHV